MLRFWHGAAVDRPATSERGIEDPALARRKGPYAPDFEDWQSSGRPCPAVTRSRLRTSRRRQRP